jgi:hypothetical protein
MSDEHFSVEPPDCMCVTRIKQEDDSLTVQTCYNMFLFFRYRLKSIT